MQKFNKINMHTAINTLYIYLVNSEKYLYRLQK